MRDVTYPRLVSASYLLLAAIRDPHARLMRARRLASSALAQHMSTKAEDADELFWNCLAPIARRTTGSRAGFLYSWTNWARIRGNPGDIEQVVLEARLAAATPQARVGYLVLVAEEKSPEIAARYIKALELRASVDSVIAAGEALRENLINDGVGLRRQQEILAEPLGTGPNAIRVPSTMALRVRSMTRRTLPVVGAVAVILASLLIVQVLDDSKRPGSDQPTALPAVKRIEPAAWTTATKLDLSVWPTRGSMAGDQNVTDRALRAWRKAAKGGGVPGPAQQVQLLYAGPVKTQTVVALTDGQRVARYIDQKGSVEVDQIPLADAHGSSSLALTETGEGTTYLLAPWVTAAKSGASGTEWAPVTVADGVTDVVRKSQGGGKCGPRAVLQLRARGIEDAFAVADFGRVAMTHLTYVPSKTPTEKTHEVDASVGRTLSRVSCQLGDEKAEQTNAINVWVVWSGKLPESTTNNASVLCVRTTRASGKSQVTTSLLAGTNAPATTMSQIAGGQACGGADQDVVVAGWYQASNKAWYYIATGSRKVSDITVVGGEVPDSSGDGLVAHGPFTERKKTDFSVTAKGTGGAKVAILR